ncbi:putative transcriptional regulator, LysR family protein [Subtercola lobariae]|uniref:Transcriptional regulator, LysR family protein n=2 Tax=Subtercola lobariae TaxID=1588641 RepID=A0A917B4T0_9MICO|nr:putative transcriptional regulator, LysR family protein [Subtercola lobariae]
MSPEGEALVPLLAAFEAAANESHITRAAELLNLPQSTVSRRLQALEKVVGVPLFHSAGRGVQLTAQGRDLLARIRTPLRAIDEALADVKANADPESGLVRFGFPFTLGPVSVPSLLADFHVTAPHIRLRLVQGHAEALTAQLQGGSLDLAIVIPAPLELRSFALGEQPIALYVSREHPLAGRSHVDVAELADETFIANPPDYNLRSLLETWCAEAGFAPRIAFEITEFETMRSLIAHGLGVALLPAPETTHPGLVGIPLGGPSLHTRTIGLVAATTRPTPAAERLRAYLAEHAGRVIAASAR